MDVVPHCNERSLVVEHLDPMTFPIYDIHELFVIDDYVVRPDELSGVDPGASP